MGADLYISQLFDPQYKKWQKRFYRAVAYRDRLPEDSLEREEAQKRVEMCYERMYERGYYRDSYNDSDLLWKFNLSWRADVTPMLNRRHQLTPEKASALLAMLKDREQVFYSNLASENEPAQRYFRQKYTLFKKFLTQSIQLGRHRSAPKRHGHSSHRACRFPSSDSYRARISTGWQYPIQIRYDQYRLPARAPNILDVWSWFDFKYVAQIYHGLVLFLKKRSSLKPVVILIEWRNADGFVSPLLETQANYIAFSHCHPI